MTEVSGGKNLVAFAVPGQVSRRATLWRNLKKKLENGKLNGLVIVSCYGYHDLGRLPLREQALFDPESPDDSSKNIWSQSGRMNKQSAGSWRTVVAPEKRNYGFWS